MSKLWVSVATVVLSVIAICIPVSHGRVFANTPRLGEMTITVLPATVELSVSNTLEMLVSVSTSLVIGGSGSGGGDVYVTPELVVEPKPIPAPTPKPSPVAQIPVPSPIAPTVELPPSVPVIPYPDLVAPIPTEPVASTLPASDPLRGDVWLWLALFSGVVAIGTITWLTVHWWRLH